VPDQDKTKEQLIVEIAELRRKIAVIEASLDGREFAPARGDYPDRQSFHSLKMEAVGRLAGGIAHDFNNILTAVQGNAELLKMGGFNPIERDDMISQILEASKRAAGLTRQLLDFARKGTFRIVAVDTASIIDKTIALLSHSVDKRIKIEVDLQAAPTAVLGDPSQIENALVNLGMNACDAMPNGGVLTFATRNVALDEESCLDYANELAPGSYVEVSVRDTGSGMDPTTRSRIFEPFFTTKEVGQGTGLGLASVYGCIKSHYGNIRVESQPGKGTTFKILLHTAEKAYDDASDAPDRDLVRGTGHILLVDDEGIVRAFAATALQSLGYSVATCTDGKQAVEHFRNHCQDIDLVILDLIMPKLSGPDTFKELKLIDPDVRVLISSGFSRKETTNGLLDEGALGLLSKPFRIDELSQMVARHIRTQAVA